MEQSVLVYIDLQGKPIKVGRIWSHCHRTRESMTFEYDREWLNHPNRFSLDPALKINQGQFHSSHDKPLFGALDDSAPDRWGRTLMRRFESKSATIEGRRPRKLQEIDYLLMVDDESRQGALRFKKEEDGCFLAKYEGKKNIPPSMSLSLLSEAANHLNSMGPASYNDLQMLLAPGGSLGGARPKAAIKSVNGDLYIAKFSKDNDEFDVMGWEAVALSLARKSGIEVPDFELKKVGTRKALLSKRFDRKGYKGSIRIPFLSAMSALSAKDGEEHGYIEIVDFINQKSACRKEDLKELWRRIVFSVLITNVDDHLRNHGFIYSGQTGWRLSPAYDLNPTPIDISPERFLKTSIDINLVDFSASIDLAMEVISYFDLKVEEAKQILKEVSSATSLWMTEASNFNIEKKEVEWMASAFEHEDSQKARIIS